MSKSIIIFGKGPSVLKCTRKLIDEHDEIAICNYPVLNNFFYPLIKDRTINYHFANCGTFDSRYTNEINNKLNIQKIFNTNKGINHYKNFLKNNKRFQDINLYESIYKNYFYKKYKLNPSTGLFALYYVLNSKLYNKITLVGYDNFSIGKPVYYYNIKDISSELKYLIDLGFYSKDGLCLVPTGHCPEKTLKYINDCIKQNPNINFKIITNNEKMKKMDYSNLELEL